MSEAEATVEVIARGVFTARGRVLLCRNRRGVWFLPGGHVEPGEGARAALVRELDEELGVAVETGAFLGVVEYGFVQDGVSRSEINLVFRARAPDLDPDRAPRAIEPHLHFAWTPASEIDRLGLQPAPLRKRLPAWLRGGAAPRAWSSNREERTG